MDDDNKLLEFVEDSFDFAAHKRAAIQTSLKKAVLTRTKRYISFGKGLLTIAALGVFILLFFVIMNFLGPG